MKLDRSAQQAHLAYILACQVPGCGRDKIFRRSYCSVHLKQKEREARQALRAEKGGLYFIRQCSGGPVKIGIADNFKRRLNALQSGHHEKLVIVATIADRTDLERRLHFALRQYRVRGEWFKWEPEVELVCALAREGRIEAIEKYLEAAFAEHIAGMS